MAQGLNGGDIPLSQDHTAAAASAPVSQGHLNPAASPPVSRLPAPDDLRELVRHFWVPEWSLPEGRTVTAQTLPYPALNLVIEPPAVMLYGPTTHRSDRTLSGRGWAVGVLLRPAATVSLGLDATSLVDTARALDEPALVARVVAAMTCDAPTADRHHAAVAEVAAWVRDRATAVGDTGALANAATALIERDPTLRRVADLAAALHVTPRTLQRTLRRCTGFTPAETMRRTRLQHAAAQVAGTETPGLARVAHDAGYADHAHMSRDFRAVLDHTPSGLRRGP